MQVRGINVLVLISDGVDYKPWVCARSVTLNVTTDFIETSGPGDGVFATFLPTKNSFTGSMDGIVSINTPGKFSLPELRAKQYAQTPLLMRFQRTDDGGNLYTEQAFFYIASSSDTGSFDDMNTFSIGLQGTGAITPFSLIKEDMNYLVYSALITQSGTADPVANVLENTLGAPIVWTRGASGSYNGILVGAFPSLKTLFPVSPHGVTIFPISSTSNFEQVTTELVSIDQVRILTKTGTTGAPSAADDVLINYPVEIRVYN